MITAVKLSHREWLKTNNRLMDRTGRRIMEHCRQTEETSTKNFCRFFIIYITIENGNRLLRAISRNNKGLPKNEKPFTVIICTMPSSPYFH